MTTPLVDSNWLLAHYGDANIRVVDARFILTKPEAGRAAFEGGHIPGAVFVDLEHDLSAGVRADRVGGRHPLPSVAQLEALFSRLGISNEHHVVAYDDPGTGGGFYAPHLWWMLRYMGHDKVSVLDGGFPAWVASGGAIETDARSYEAAVFHARPRPEMLVDADYVQGRRAGAVLVDSRAGERFRGEVEPLDWKAGHIPGAINRNWAEGMQDGRWKAAEAQAERFESVRNGGEVIVYCGSGVSAAGNLIALEIAGVHGAKLYAGSWSDWISDDSRPVATGGE